jgi:hypothetical protein
LLERHDCCFILQLNLSAGDAFQAP